MDLHATRRPVRMAAAETDSRVPTSRSSNQSSSTDGAQKGAKTDPKPFTTENASVVHQHHHAWREMAHRLQCAYVEGVWHMFPFRREPYLKVISFEMSRDRMIGPGALMIRLMSVTVWVLSRMLLNTCTIEYYVFSQYQPVKQARMEPKCMIGACTYFW